MQIGQMFTLEIVLLFVHLKVIGSRISHEGSCHEALHLYMLVRRTGREHQEFRCQARAVAHDAMHDARCAYCFVTGRDSCDEKGSTSAKKPCFSVHAVPSR